LGHRFAPDEGRLPEIGDGAVRKIYTVLFDIFYASGRLAADSVAEPGNG
jgi:hypothetical protein